MSSSSPSLLSAVCIAPCSRRPPPPAFHPARLLVGTAPATSSSSRGAAIPPSWGYSSPRRASTAPRSPSAPARRHYVSFERQRFFTQRNQTKRCPRCGKANLLWLERCNFCNALTPEHQVELPGPDPLVEAVLTERYFGRPPIAKTWDMMFLECRFPVARCHLLVIPKMRVEDLKKCGRLQQPLLKSMFKEGVARLKELYNVRADYVAGFSYPSEYNQLCLHIIVPPVRNFLLFRRATWYSYFEVQKQLYETGVFRPRKGFAALDIDPTVVMLDRRVREKRAATKNLDVDPPAKNLDPAAKNLESSTAMRSLLQGEEPSGMGEEHGAAVGGTGGEKGGGVGESDEGEDEKQERRYGERMPKGKKLAMEMNA